MQLLSQLDRNSNTIRFHHATLRQRAASAGVEEASAAWSEAMRDTGALRDYASAALTTGEAKWVQNGFKWCDDEVRVVCASCVQGESALLADPSPLLARSAVTFPRWLAMSSSPPALMRHCR